MAIITDAISDALNEDKYLLKFAFYGFPVFFCINFYITKNMFGFYFLGVPTAIFLLALLSIGIHNLNSNKREILTFNLFSVFVTIIKMFFALTPHLIISFTIGFLITTFVKMPEEIEYLPLAFKCIVWGLLSAITFTCYLAFSKTQEIQSAYSLKVISESTVSVLVNFIFLIPQLAIVDSVLVGFIWYILFFFHIPYQNPAFVYYCAIVIIFNVSVSSGYFAQVAYESIQSKDEEYKDNYYMKTEVKNDTKSNNTNYRIR